MTTFGRPGVFIQEAALPTAVDIAQGSDAVGAFVGKLPKGPTQPVMVSNWSEFVKIFGGISASFPTTLAAYQFFSNGGRNAYIVRVVGANAAAASATLVDRQDPAVDTLTVSANTVGTWANSSGLSVEIVASSANRFGINVYGQPASVGAGDRSNLLESYGDLSMDPADPRYAVAYINALAKYITLADLGSDAASFADARPAVSSNLVTLSGGADGDDPVRADYADATALLDEVETPLLLNSPDAAFIYTTAGDNTARTAALNILADLVLYADGGNGFAIIDTPAGLSAEEATTWASDVISATGQTAAGAQAAAYYPWIQVPDTTRAAPGLPLALPPGPAVMGQYQATDTARGVFKSPAGYSTRLNTAIGLEKRLTNADLDALNSAEVPVNALRVIPGAGVAIMGARTLLNEPGFRYINMRRSLIFLKKELTDLSAFAVFENNDSRLWDSITSALGSFLSGYWAQGGLRGDTPAQAFYVRCDETTNTETDVANGRVNIEIGVALEYPAEFVLITIGQITGSASVSQG